MTALFWFRRDLRLADNPGLSYAIARGKPVIPVFLLDDEDAGSWAPGGASHWWLHGSLERLAHALNARGSRLILRRGSAETTLEKLIAETKAEAVFWNRRYEPWATARDERIQTMLRRRGIDVQSFNAALLCEPWTIATKDGAPYRVFTPFRNALRAAERSAPLAPVPKRIPVPKSFPASDDLASWSLRPKSPDWAGGMRETWTPGEDGAQARLDAFADRMLLDYHDKRNIPGVAGTSRLSPHLHFGEIGPRQIRETITARAFAATGHPIPRGVETYLSEIAWREFSYHLLFHFPSLPETPLRADFARFPWNGDVAGLTAWQRGMTGYPIVDAGMRELRATGWMHNRVRMIVASFLVKDLLHSWILGEAWFWETLVDADLASNAASWQWVAGCGADAAPYFRVFNPSLQGAKFDPRGTYVRRWVPELAKLHDAALHTPRNARPIDLADAGIVLGKTYPFPIVDHARARTGALIAFKQINRRKSEGV